MGSAAGKNARVSGSYRRRAHHSGSWYDSDPSALHRTLEGYLGNVAAGSDASVVVRAVIVPHAGYSYSGPTAAHSYHALRQALAASPCLIEHLLVLHPAHHVHLQGCAVSGASVLETPIGNLTVDEALRREILALSPQFTVMDSTTDEEEHSGEMQYPYLAKILGDRSIPVLPLMCGALSTDQEATFGRLLAPIVARPNVVCVISSDFCHWGSRFRYQPTAEPALRMPIHEFIREMDQQGMDLIALQQPGAFAEYLRRTKNTICGRHAISVWLQAIASVDGHLMVNFVQYAQSSAVMAMSDSSVSYASAVVTAATG